MTVLRSLDAVADVVNSLPKSGRIIVGIAGAPGAGKSTIAASLMTLLPAAALLPMDGFHLAQRELQKLGRRERMGAPDTFDTRQFMETLRRLRRDDGTVLAPDFDRDAEEPVPDAIAIPTETRVVVVEGNYLLLSSGGWERVAAQLDATFFVRLDYGIRIERLIARHERFGKSAADARDWALGTDERNAAIVEAASAAADHLIELPVDLPHSTERQPRESIVPTIVVEIMPKAELLDPQGKAVTAALSRLGKDHYTEVRIGKRIELTVAGPVDETVLAEVRELAEEVLANTVIEDVVSVHEATADSIVAGEAR